MTLDQVSTSIAKTCKVQTDSHQGMSDHVSRFPYPSYHQRIGEAKRAVKFTTVWNEDAIPHLQDCFDNTDCSTFSSLAAPDDPNNGIRGSHIHSNGLY